MKCPENGTYMYKLPCICKVLCFMIIYLKVNLLSKHEIRNDSKMVTENS